VVKQDSIVKRENIIRLFDQRQRNTFVDNAKMNCAVQMKYFWCHGLAKRVEE